MSVDPKFEHLRALAMRYATPSGAKTGTVNFAACPCCGALKWSSSHPKPEDDLTISVFVADGICGCSDCAQVQQRAPEIFQWAVAMALNQVRTALEDERLKASQTPPASDGEASKRESARATEPNQGEV